MVDPSLGDGCLIQSEFDDGSIVRIGFDLIQGGAYVTAFNMAWGEIEEGGIYSVLFSSTAKIMMLKQKEFTSKTCQGPIFSSIIPTFCLISQQNKR